MSLLICPAGPNRPSCELLGPPHPTPCLAAVPRKCILSPTTLTWPHRVPSFPTPTNTFAWLDLSNSRDAEKVEMTTINKDRFPLTWAHESYFDIELPLLGLFLLSSSRRRRSDIPTTTEHSGLCPCLRPSPNRPSRTTRLART